MLSVSFEMIQSSLGSLLMLWGEIERTARSEVAQLRGELPKPVHGISAVLRDWEGCIVNPLGVASMRPMLAAALHAQLRAHLQVRNGVCHGLNRITAESAKSPAQLCWSLDGDVRCIDFEELQASFRWLAKAPYAMSLISKAEPSRIGDRVIDTQENRQWWLTEFWIDLSVH